MWVECVDNGAKLLRLFRVLVGALNYLHGVKQLRHIRGATSPGTYQQQFMAHAVVVPHVVFHFVPNERGLVLETP